MGDVRDVDAAGQEQPDETGESAFMWGVVTVSLAVGVCAFAEPAVQGVLFVGMTVTLGVTVAALAGWA